MRYFLGIFLAVVALNVSAQSSYVFAQYDQDTLKLDVYKPVGTDKNICVVYIFGGGFAAGSRDASDNVPFYTDLAARGYTVVAMDYRLGLKGVQKVSVLDPRLPFLAVRLATEDVIAATSYLIDNRQTLGIDTSRMVMVGSSAGAITALQTAYEMSRKSTIASSLPPSFKYAGVVSLAGAVFSIEGKPRYVIPPAPTAFFHGTKDKVVVYKKIRILNIGMFGTDALVKIFNKQGYPYVAVRYQGAKHEVAEFPRFYIQDQICSIIDLMADKKFTNQLDIEVKDKNALTMYMKNLTRKELYNGN